MIICSFISRYAQVLKNITGRLNSSGFTVFFANKGGGMQKLFLLALALVAIALVPLVACAYGPIELKHHDQSANITGTHQVTGQVTAPIPTVIINQHLIGNFASHQPAMTTKTPRMAALFGSEVTATTTMVSCRLQPLEMKPFGFGYATGAFQDLQEVVQARMVNGLS